jgi:hypothetical protein
VGDEGHIELTKAGGNGFAALVRMSVEEMKINGWPL